MEVPLKQFKLIMKAPMIRSLQILKLIESIIPLTVGIQHRLEEVDTLEVEMQCQLPV